MKHGKILTDQAIPPGEHLKEILEYKGITQKELAKRIGRPEKTISGIATGKVAITPDTAIELERVLGVSAKFWLNLEADYQLTKAHIKELDRLREDVPKLANFPIPDMIKRELIEPYIDKVFELRGLLEFLKIPSLDLIQAQPDYQAVYRSGSGGPNPEVVAVWLREGQIKAENMELPEFDKDAIEKLIPEIRSMTLQQPEEWENRLKDSLASAGLGLIFVKEYTNGGVNGAYYRIDNGHFIQINLKGKWADIFWFTLFHELGHALLHTQEDIIVDYDGDAGQKEEEANDFAYNTLIPPDAYQAFISSKERNDKGYLVISTQDLKQFANEIGVNTGIVSGRLHHDEVIDPKNFNKKEVRPKFNWAN